MRAKVKDKDERPLVGEAGRRFVSEGDRLLTWGAMVVLALLTGFAVGLVTYLLMNLSGWLTALVWKGVGERFDIPVFSLLCCSVGGIVIGVWTMLSHNEIDDLNTVMGDFKRTGSYRLENPAATSVSFLLPLVFGGSIGFEAGLTGIICAGCCWIRDKLKLAGLRAAGIADVTIAASLSAIFGAPLAGVLAGIESEGADSLPVDAYDMRRESKLVLYLAAAVGAFGAIVCFNDVFGSSGGFPRFDAIQAKGAQYGWSVLALLGAYVLLLVFRGVETACARLAARMDDQGESAALVKPICAGVVLGAVALALPLVLFPGEEQCTELKESWEQMAPWFLIVTALFKAAVTPMCIKLGWKGGDLFPAIFAGVALGYGLAGITGADPMLMVTVCSTAFLAGVTGSPVLTIGILAIVFPLRGILWMGLAAVLGSIAPIPAPLRE